MFVDFTLNLQYEAYLHTYQYHIWTISTTTLPPKTQLLFDSKTGNNMIPLIQLRHASTVTFRSYVVFQAKMLHQFGGSLPLQSFPGPKTCLKDRFNQTRTWRLKEISLLTYWYTLGLVGGFKKENYYFASPGFWHATRADPILIVLGWHWSHSICFKIAKAVGHALPRSQAATAAPYVVTFGRRSYTFKSDKNFMDICHAKPMPPQSKNHNERVW